MKPTQINGIAHRESSTGRASARRRSGRLGVAGKALLVLAALSVAACTNFITGDDLKGSIQQTATEANAESVSVTISATPSSGGSLSNNGLVTRKVGVDFTLTATAYDAYVFSGWSATGAGNVSFANASSSTTNAKVGKKASDIVITANFTARPKVKAISPANQATNVLRNQPIVVTFSRVMDTASFSQAGNIVITGYLDGSSNPVEETLFRSGEASSYFKLTPNASSTGFSLEPQGTFMPSGWNIFLFISSNIVDADNHAMMEDYSDYSFLTGTLVDTSAPMIDLPIVVHNGGSASDPVVTALASGPYSGAYAVRTSPITISTTYTTSTSSVTAKLITLTETGNIGGSSTTTPSLEARYMSDYPYTLRTTDEGPKTLQLYLTGSTNVPGSPESITLFYDRSDPTVSGVLVNGGSDYTSSPAVTVAFTAADIGSGVVAYSVSETAGTYNWTDIAWTASAPESAAYSLSAGDGAHTVYVYTRDGSGRISAAGSDEVTMDTSDPVVTVPATRYVSSAGSVALSASIADAGIGASGVTDYGLSTSTTTAPTSWSAYSAAMSYSTNAEGTYYLWGRDRAGNTGCSPTPALIYETGKPVVTVNGTVYRNVAGTVTIDAAIADAGSGMGEYGLSASTATPPATWTAYAAPMSYAVSATGTYYLWGRDRAGNTDCSTTPALVYETVKPTVTAGTVYTNTASGAVTNGWIITDGGSGMGEYGLSTSTTTAPTSWAAYGASLSYSVSATGTYYLWGRDRAGNTNYATTPALVYETGKPAVTVSSTLCQNTAGTVALAASITDTGSGMGEYGLSTSTTTLPATWTAYGGTMSFTVSAEGTYYLWGRDRAGNTGYATTPALVYETGLPIVTVDLTLYRNTAGAVTLSASITDTGSGMGEYGLSASTTTAPTIWTAYSATMSYTVSAEGTYYLWGRDRAGNTGCSPTPAQIYEMGKPVVTVNGTVYRNAAGTVTLDASITDTGSGMGEYGLSASTTTAPTSWTAYSGTITYAVSGPGTYYLWGRDRAGNTDCSTTPALVYETGKPVVSVGSTLYRNSSGTVTIDASIADAGSGMGEYGFSISTTAAPTSWTAYGGTMSFTVSADGTYYLWGRDRAGNTDCSTTPALVYETGLPIVTVDLTLYRNTAGAVTLSASITDTESGVSEYGLSASTTTAPPSWTAYSATMSYTVSAEGTYYLWGRDRAGNTSHAATPALVYDTAAPLVDDATKKPSANNSDSPTLTVYLTSADLAGVQAIRYWAGDVAQAGATYHDADAIRVTDLRWTATLDNIAKTDTNFRFTLIDNAGNETADGYLMTYENGKGWDLAATGAVAPRALYSSSAFLKSSGKGSSTVSPYTLLDALSHEAALYIQPASASGSASMISGDGNLVEAGRKSVEASVPPAASGNHAIPATFWTRSSAARGSSLMGGASARPGLEEVQSATDAVYRETVEPASGGRDSGSGEASASSASGTSGMASTQAVGLAVKASMTVPQAASAPGPVAPAAPPAPLPQPGERRLAILPGAAALGRRDDSGSDDAPGME